MRKKEKLVFGVGVNDADYQLHECITITDEMGKKKPKLVWICPFYQKWKSMLRRCYSEEFWKKNPTYEGCSVCEEWLTFSSFKRWMETQDWEGKQIDKDVLVSGNKIYGPEACVFVNHNVNVFLTESNTTRGQWAIGVNWDKRLSKFRAQCSDGGGKSKYLGLFQTELEAHLAWLKCKQEVALKLASEQTDHRVAKALIDRYENYVAQEKEIA